MATLSMQRVNLAGITPTYAAASAGGDLVPVADDGWLIVKNGGGASITVTIATPGITKFGLSEPDVVVTVPAASEKWIGPLDPNFTDPTVGGAVVTYSAVTTVTVAALIC